MPRRSAVVRPLAAAAAFLLMALAAPAQPAGQVDALAQTIRLPEMIAIMREEGLAYGEELGAGLLGGAPDAWDQVVSDLYQTGRLEAAVRAGLADALAGADLTDAIAFFGSPPGRDFIELELSARAAMLDPDIDAAAQESAALAMADLTERFRLIERFVTANDLIEANVVGAMNSNVAFFDGLAAGGALPPEMTEEAILSDVWAQEPEIRATATEWVYSYLLMAYSPATDADLEAYIAFSESEAGRQLNRALFHAFHEVFDDVSHGLGRAAAKLLVTEEL